jgi:glycosyltransferase-like protein
VKLRIAMYTHSLNPRGGVVHALSLSEALQEAGHDVTLIAPAKAGERLFRETSVRTYFFPAAPVAPFRGCSSERRFSSDGEGPALSERSESNGPALSERRESKTPLTPALSPGCRGEGDGSLPPECVPNQADGLLNLVQQRLGEYSACVRKLRREFDLHHAHDAMSGGALAGLRAGGEIGALARTVHHLDHWDDPFLAGVQDRSVRSADLLFCVSRKWQEQLQTQFARHADVVYNGVDGRRFHPSSGESDHAACEELIGPGQGPFFLCVGGVERRKNTLAALRAFLTARDSLPAGARLVIVGGASLLDHSDYRRQFEAMLAAAACPGSVVVTGVVADRAMPALYRTAAALVFPSLVEGFGLAVLEAMACGTPVITSRRAPFTEYLTEEDALLVDPEDIADIAGAMQRIVDPPVRDRLVERGRSVAARFTWPACAQRHLAGYQRLLANEQGGHDARNALCGSLA